MKSDYKNMKEWRRLAFIGALLSTFFFVCYFITSNELKNDRILATQTIETYKDSLNIIKVSQIEEKQVEIDYWNLFVEALIQVESRGDSLVVGDGGNSIGCLQIQKSYIDYVNVFGNKNFTYDDRLSRKKSIEIFESMQSLRNKDRNIIKAIQLHNPRAGDDYYRKIFTEMFK